MSETGTKTGFITVRRNNGRIINVDSDFHIDELFKIIHFMRSNLDGSNPDKDVLRAMEKMGWPVPGKSFTKY